MYKAITILVDLAKESEWESIGEALSPELHQLISEWDSLLPDKRGELACHAFGKHGGDILVPGALVKEAGKCAKSGRVVEMIPIIGNLLVVLYDPDCTKGYIAVAPRDTHDRCATINLSPISTYDPIDYFEILGANICGQIRYHLQS